jgi:hypothetical protein
MSGVRSPVRVALSAVLGEYCTLVASVVAGDRPNVDEDATRVQAMIRFLKNLGY